MIITNIHTYLLYQFQQSLKTQTKSTDFDMHESHNTSPLKC
jgi:hypothetical protein